MQLGHLWSPSWSPVSGQKSEDPSFGIFFPPEVLNWRRASSLILLLLAGLLVLLRGVLWHRCPWSFIFDYWSTKTRQRSKTWDPAVHGNKHWQMDSHPSHSDGRISHEITPVIGDFSSTLLSHHCWLVPTGYYLLGMSTRLVVLPLGSWAHGYIYFTMSCCLKVASKQHQWENSWCLPQNFNLF